MSQNTPSPNHAVAHRSRTAWRLGLAPFLLGVLAACSSSNASTEPSGDMPGPAGSFGPNLPGMQPVGGPNDGDDEFTENPGPGEQPGNPNLPSNPDSPNSPMPNGPGNPDVPNTPNPDSPNPDSPNPDSPNPDQPDLDCTTLDTGANVLRRLTRLEYQLTLSELLQLPEPPVVDSIPEDGRHEGFRTFAALQNVSTQHLRAFSDLAAELASDLLNDPERRDAVLGCDLDAPACLQEFTARWGRLAFRRSLSEEEVTSLTERAIENSETTADQFSFVIGAVLSSPSFLYRIEVGDAPDGISSLSGLELASKLSFTLLGRTPSGDLLDRAELGELDTEAGLRQVAEELLADERAQQYFDAFFRQWMDFEQLRIPPEPPAGWSQQLLPQMIEETERLLDDFVWAGGDFFDALTANYTYVAPELAAFYGLPPAAEGNRIEFPAEHHRANTGLLTHASVISAKGDGDLVAHRGAWLRQTFLCENLEVPAELLNAISDELEGLSYFEILAKRNEDLACRGCHALIDPIGVGFAWYDGTGQYDPDANLDQFNITPALPGSEPAEFSSIAELAAKLKERPELSECMTERVFLYTQGREPLAEDACTVEQVSQAFETQQHSFEQLLLSMVNAPEFRLRRPAEPSATE